ncbi:hypothetical protein SE92_16580 [Bradyrhizobium sp. AT1]|nr:hypothetical protein SE92_16580 [Bradyrhizobium sp. AT1]
MNQTRYSIGDKARVIGWDEHPIVTIQHNFPHPPYVASQRWQSLSSSFEKNQTKSFHGPIRDRLTDEAEQVTACINAPQVIVPDSTEQTDVKAGAFDGSLNSFRV